MRIVVFVVLLSGATLLAISLPLALRKVPMNRLWGVRIRPAFESEHRWYAINAYGGRLLALGSLLIIATGMIGLLLSPDLLVPYAWCAAAISSLSVLVPCVVTLAWVNRSHSS